MRYANAVDKNGQPVDVAAIVEAGIAFRALARANPRVAARTVTDEIGDASLACFGVFLRCAVAHIERAQRIAHLFRLWRAGKRSSPGVVGRPDDIGTPFRRIRRFHHQEPLVNAVLQTTLAVRALDREEGTSRESRFIADLEAAFDGWITDLLEALVLLAERDRRLARRFRSWRRAKAARASSPPDAGGPSPRRSRTRSR